jgi:hypothetical protein
MESAYLNTIQRQTARDIYDDLTTAGSARDRPGERDAVGEMGERDVAHQQPKDTDSAARNNSPTVRDSISRRRVRR